MRKGGVSSVKNSKTETHDTKNCFLREKNKKKVKNFKVEAEDETVDSDNDAESDEDKMEEMLRKMKTNE